MVDRGLRVGSDGIEIIYVWYLGYIEKVDYCNLWTAYTAWPQKESIYIRFMRKSIYGYTDLTMKVV